MRKTKYGNIEAERVRFGSSKDDFAKSLGIATKTYYNWLNGMTPIPSDALMKMSNIFNVSLEYLLSLTDMTSSLKALPTGQFFNPIASLYDTQ